MEEATDAGRVVSSHLKARGYAWSNERVALCQIHERATHPPPSAALKNGEEK